MNLSASVPLLRNWRKWHSCPLDRGLWTSMTRTKGLAAAAARECVEATNQQRSLLLLTTMTNPSLYEGQRSEYVRASLFAARSCSSDKVTGPVQCLAACVSKIEQALTGVVLKFWRIRFAGDRKQFPLKPKLHAEAWMVECSNQMFLSMGQPPLFRAIPKCPPNWRG